MSPRAHARTNSRVVPESYYENLAPEVDPSLAMGALTLLGGTLTVMRSRRSRRPVEHR